jgi:hypothetical protein
LGGKCAINALHKRKDPPCFYQLQFWDRLECGGNDVLVFLLFQATGAVDQSAAWFEEGGGASEKSELLGWHSEEILVGETPPDIDSASEHAGIGAGCVDENPIKSLVGQGAFGLHGIGLEHRCDLDAHSLKVGFESVQSGLVQIAGH